LIHTAAHLHVPAVHGRDDLYILILILKLEVNIIVLQLIIFSGYNTLFVSSISKTNILVDEETDIFSLNLI